SYDAPVSTVLRWVVLSPARDEYLAPGGTFAPYTGVEATTRDPQVLSRREEAVGLLVADAAFTQIGTHHVEAWRSTGCSGERFLGSTDFEVLDDADHDGLARDVELAAGTNPADDDSDDDGLRDGDDGLGDTDGDGAIDARDCDSDDDGLPDGLESGAWEPAS